MSLFLSFLLLFVLTKLKEKRDIFFLFFQKCGVGCTLNEKERILWALQLAYCWGLSMPRTLILNAQTHTHTKRGRQRFTSLVRCLRSQSRKERSVNELRKITRGLHLVHSKTLTSSTYPSNGFYSLFIGRRNPKITPCRVHNHLWSNCPSTNRSTDPSVCSVGPRVHYSSFDND